MIPPDRRRELIEEAETLAGKLSAFKTPNTGKPVDPSRLAEVLRFLRANTLADTRDMVDMLPGSYLRKASASAEPQLKEVKRRVKPLLERIADAEELAFLLGWARRMMTIDEAQGMARRGGKSARGARRRGRR